MQVAVWVILFASVLPKEKHNRRGEQESEENKTENEKIQRASIAKSDEETTSVFPCFAKNDTTWKRDGRGHKTKQHSRKQRKTKSIKCTKGKARRDSNFRWEGRRGDAKDAKRWRKE